MILLSKDSWEIKKTKLMGNGLFAKKNIRPGAFIGDYLGRLVRTAEVELEDQSNFYLMYYHDRAAIVPDLNKNGIHQINHSCRPNVGLYVFKGHTLFFALRKIFAHEELTTSYMLAPQDNLCNPCPHVCRCGSSNCTGTMHLSPEKFKSWSKYLAELALKSKRKRVTYGKILPTLSNYPEAIPGHSIYDLFGSNAKSAVTSQEKHLPSIKTLRKTIRDNGTKIHFSKLGTTVVGIAEEEILQEN